MYIKNKRICKSNTMWLTSTEVEIHQLDFNKSLGKVLANKFLSSFGSIYCCEESFFSYELAIKTNTL